MGRLLGLLLHAVAGFGTVLVVFPRLSQPARERRVERWAAGMLARLRVELRRQGQPAAAGPALIVANHISWLDILVLHAAGYCRFISKAEVRHWPLLGRMASAAGTLYIERAARRDALRVIHQMAEAFARGEVLAAFPEGTTSDGTRMLAFHANLMQAALAQQTPVQPAGLRYLEAGSGAASRAPCYVDDEPLLTSLWRTLSAPPLLAVLTFGAPQTAGERDRRRFAADLQREVDRLRQAPLD